jgi:hypothetical protein
MKRTAKHDSAVLHNQGFSPLQIFHFLSKDDALLIAPINQDADGVYDFSGIYVIMPLMHTPPPMVMNLDVGM